MEELKQYIAEANARIDAEIEFYENAMDIEPDDDEEYGDEVVTDICLVKIKIVNIDTTVILQSPKLKPYIESMRDNIALALKIDRNCVSVKATTEEWMGFTGSGEGISAYSICLIENPCDFVTMDVTDNERCSGCSGCSKAGNI